MNWYIGQKIVAIRTHSEAVFKEGDIFLINGLAQGCCYVRIDIGIEGNGITHCNTCKKMRQNNGVWWMDERNFAPLDEMTAHESAIKELLKENEIHENIH